MSLAWGKFPRPEKMAEYLPDHTVGTLANDILNFILVGHVEGDLSRSSRRGVLLTHEYDSETLFAMVSFGHQYR